MFWLCIRLPFFQRTTIPRLIDEAINKQARSTTKQHAQSNCEKCESNLRDSERVRWASEYERYGGEQEEQDAESESCIQREEEDYGLGVFSTNIINTNVTMLRSNFLWDRKLGRTYFSK